MENLLNLFLECVIILASDLVLRPFIIVNGNEYERRTRKIYLMIAQVPILFFFIVVLTIWHHTTFILIVGAICISFRVIHMKLYAPKVPKFRGAIKSVSMPIGRGSRMTESQQYESHVYQKARLDEQYSYPRECTEDSRYFQQHSAQAGLRHKSMVHSGLRTDYSSIEPRKRLLPRIENIKESVQSVTKLWSSHSPLQHLTTPTTTPNTVGQTVADRSQLIREPMESSHPYLTQTITPPTPSTTPPGLVNPGNTCFVNSILQCLTWTPGFINILPQFSITLTQTEESFFLENINGIFVLSHCVPDNETEFQSINTSKLLTAISHLAPHLVAPLRSPQYQQDAAEFLLWLLNYLHAVLQSQSKSHQNVFTEAHIEDMNKNKQLCMDLINKVGSSNLQELVTPMTNLSEVDWDLYWYKNSSSLYDLFLGQILEARECLTCKKVTMNMEYFTLLPVPISSLNNIACSLSDCFKKFGEQESLVYDNMVSCSCNQDLRPATRLALLSVVPKCLVIQLTRFSYNSNLHTAEKKDTPVFFHQKIDLYPYTMKAKLNENHEDHKQMMYELCAFCVHSGAQSTSFGHYIAFCKATNQQWYEFNDNIVSTVPDIDTELNSEFVLRNAYLLFYHCVS